MPSAESHFPAWRGSTRVCLQQQKGVTYSHLFITNQASSQKNIYMPCEEGKGQGLGKRKICLKWVQAIKEPVGLYRLWQGRNWVNCQKPLLVPWLAVDQSTGGKETIEIMIFLGFFFLSWRIKITAKGQNSLFELLNVIPRLVIAQWLLPLHTMFDSMHSSCGSWAVPTTILPEKWWLCQT